MPVATPTVLPRPLVFPHLLPKPPQLHPMPLPKRRVYGHLNARRDLQREMDDLSDEENEVEDINIFIRNRGYTTSVPIGRLLTQQEEKNDADDTDESESHSGGPPSVIEDDGENESAADMDASMEDMDEAGNTTVETDDAEEAGEGDTEEDEPSDI